MVSATLGALASISAALGNVPQTVSVSLSPIAGLSTAIVNVGQIIAAEIEPSTLVSLSIVNRGQTVAGLVGAHVKQYSGDALTLVSHVPKLTAVVNN